MKKSDLNKQLEALCVKYLSKSIGKTELDDLTKLLEEPENEVLFKKYIKINYALNYNLTDYGTAKAKLLLLWEVNNQSTKNNSKKVFPFYQYAIAASIAVLLFSSIYFNIYSSKTEENNHKTQQAEVLPGSKKAILTLNDGKKLVLDGINNFKNDEAESDGKSIIYNAKKTQKALIYNYLSIPRGGEFFVILSDGTKVWLNSESKLKYPVHFISGESRKVELLYGEAYFDVSSSNNHNGARFKVISQGQEIEVLGTEFNIKAYKSDNYIATTLVEGRVGITHMDSSIILKPSQQAIVINNTSDISISTVDIDNEISWKNGFFSFEKQSLNKMLKTLARWYDVTIIFEDEAKKNLVFSGVLKRTSDIKELLINIEKTQRVAFEIEGKIIVVK